MEPALTLSGQKVAIQLCSSDNGTEEFTMQAADNVVVSALTARIGFGELLRRWKMSSARL
jgi:hypothetical protein